MKNLVKQIESLPKKQIDNLFFKCGWLDEEHGKNKSLPDWRLEEIKNGQGKQLIDTFIQESGEENIEKLLKTFKSKIN